MTIPKALKPKLKLTNKAVRNYEVLVVFCAGKTITAAVCVLEDGHLTYAIGELTWAELKAHLSKIDMAKGVYANQSERMRTEMYLEEMHNNGIAVDIAPERHYEENLSLRFPRRIDVVDAGVRNYLKERPGITFQKHHKPLHVKHLERMAHRNGYIVRKEVDDALNPIKTSKS